ncbi:TlpA disulfide reductase family protein, partial [Xanthovirga aplysinae]|uniref:TlpA disulfide reductase family protein n=1 Tax=Xanthovirga aplysinae TaxID=2529853 RepID=UPI0012BBC2D5
ERLEIEDATQEGDSLFIPMLIFDAQIKAKLSDGHMSGSYIKNGVKDYIVPFEGEFGKTQRFDTSLEPTFDMSGKWAVKFKSGDKERDAIGIFEQSGNHLTGTFLTTTGDYRYLQGNVSGNEAWLSAFNGQSALLFHAKLNEQGELEGEYWSGKSAFSNWKGVRDENAELPDADKFTFLKEGYNKVDFSFPDLNGKMVSLSDEKFNDKVVLVQIFGTWCPNCMDETRFLTQWYDQNKEKGVEIVALSYEKKDDFDYAKSRVQKMKKRFDIHYDFLIAGTPATASESLPMLNKVMSFPTLIFIDREGKVRRIHTGFSGPGTGKYYEDYVEDFKTFTEKLIKEEKKS